MDSYVFKGGDPMYQDINYDGKIDINDVVYIGDSNPNLIGELVLMQNSKTGIFLYPSITGLVSISSMALPFKPKP